MLKTVGKVLFSGGLESPTFTAEVSGGRDYEVRTYHATKWVSTTVSGMQFDAANNAGFRRIFSYAQGNNHSKVKMELTSPVTCCVDPTCHSGITVSLYMPLQYQESPPQPKDPELFVEHREEFTVYVRMYGGFSNEKMKSEEHLKLLESLRRDNAQYAEKPFYVAVYDSPFKLTNRKNEVWVLKKKMELEG